MDKRCVLTRKIKDLPTVPLGIAHIPTLHAIAILCREYSPYPYYETNESENKDFNSNNFFISDKKYEDEVKPSELKSTEAGIEL